MLTQARLKELLHYDPETGVFIRIKYVSANAQVGDIAGCVSTNGYSVIRIDGKYYTGHRLAFLYVNGAFPSGEVDHVNGVRHDNRLCNLRVATRAENSRNTPARANNRSGFKGVSFHRLARKWAATITVDGKPIYLGLHNSPEAASEAYKAAAKHYFKKFAHQGE